MASPGMLEKRIMTQEQVGVMGSVFFVIYAMGRIINGYIGDRVSPWIMISVGLFAAGLSNLGIGILPPFAAMLVLWGTNAYAQSMLWSSLLRVISEVYPVEQAKKMLSYMVSSVATGNIAGILINTVLIERLGVAFSFLSPGAILFVLCLAVILATSKVKCRAVEKEHISMKKLLQEEKIKTVILPAMFHGMIKDNISLWMTLFFVDQFKIDLNASAGFVLFIPVVGFLGRIAFPFLISLYKQKEDRLSTHAFVLCIIASLLLLPKNVMPVTAIICLSLIYAAISVINTVLVTYFPLQFAKNGNQSSVSGIMDFFTYLGAGIGSLVFGYLVSWLGYGAMFLAYAAISAISIIMTVKMDKKA